MLKEILRYTITKSRYSYILVVETKFAQKLFMTTK